MGYSDILTQLLYRKTGPLRFRDPAIHKKIHEEYLNAGAKFIRTNTFASNKETLQEDFAEVEKNIQAAVEIARDAVNGRDAWVWYFAAK